MIVTILIILVFSGIVYVFMQQPQFGKLPSGERLARIENSPNYRNGAFQNVNHTPDLTEGASLFTVLKEFIFNKNEGKKPNGILPTIKTDLKNIHPNENAVVWFGHSSYFLQIDGKKILVDPVLSGSASPVFFTTKAFEGTDVYTADDFPEIDYLFISHDHWDHLDYQTILQLKSKIKKVICGLGTGAHFEHWGFDLENIIEKDWNETIVLDENFTVQTVSARHFSGRGFKRNQSLWMSYALQTPTLKIFIGGDSGYDNHFNEAGEKFGPFDLVILENGQYDKNWKYIHMLPLQVIQAAKDLKAKMLFPVHSAKFSLANHNWDEPLKLITELSESNLIPVMTPKIGEKTDLNLESISYKWWEFLN
ncbi:MBL fold metallo-hydrolase [Flavobacterium sp.]|uniref:MBL fold metallo-hydrolase n=1 Tax=Flavobacterium sp. TaxID=239 RepID=UPI0026247678|nr:MBL fold metallo-hydrolase [Flavobacterium sp.]